MHDLKQSTSTINSHIDFLNRQNNFANLAGLDYSMTGKWWSKNGTSYVQYAKKEVCKDFLNDFKIIQVGPIQSQQDFLNRQQNFANLAGPDYGMTGNWWSENKTSYDDCSLKTQIFFFGSVEIRTKMGKIK